MRMIKLIRKTPSSNIPQVNVSLLLAVLQFTIMIFTLNPCTTAQIKLTPISGPNDWTEIIDTLQNAKIEGRSVCISLLPPSKTPPICPTCKYSEPYRLDYLSWTKAIAELSLRYSNLTGYTIGDLQENLNLGYIRQTYIDSMEISGNSINPKLQFIKTRPNIYYVDKYAIGNGNGSSWTNAAVTIARLPWNNISGGDTVYISGGTDSVTYGKDSLESRRFASPVVITKGKDAGHNGKVIFSISSQPTGHLSTFYVDWCSNIKFVNLKFTTTNTANDYVNGASILQIRQSSNIVVDSCEIISNGDGTCLYMPVDTSITISYNHIESLPNNYETDNDPIWLGAGAGGHTIIGNTIIAGGTNYSIAHKDMIQMYHEGSSNNYQFVIANNFFRFDHSTNSIYGSSGGQGIYGEAMYLNRFLIYNNIIVMGSPSNIDLCIYGTSSTRLSIKMFNNTFVNGGSSGADVNGMDGNVMTGYCDTLIIKNNIFMNTVSPGVRNLIFSNVPTDGIGYIKYLDIDYNLLYNTGYANCIDKNVSSTITYAQFQTLYNTTGTHCNINGTTSAAKFANIWGTNANGYALVSGSPAIDAGTDLSTYFTTDISGTTRPLGTAWDLGAVESK